MENLIITGTVVRFRDTDFELLSFTKINETSINCVVCLTVNDIISALPSTAFIISKLINDLIVLIDAKTTTDILSNGFVFDTRTFSLSANAQMNITNIPNSLLEDYPLAYLDITDNLYQLIYDNRMLFYREAFLCIKNKKTAGGALKTALKQLATISAILNFKETNNL